MKRLIVFIIMMGFIMISSSFPGLAVPDDKEIAAEANSRYYNLTKFGVASFECAATDNAIEPLIERLKTQPGSQSRIEALQKVKIYRIRFDATNKIQIQAPVCPEIGNAKIDAALKKLTRASKDSLLSFWSTWQSYHIDPVFDLRFVYQITPLKDGLRIQCKKQGQQVIVLCDDQYRVTQVIENNGETKATIGLDFETTNEGYLLRRFQFYGIHAEITYQTVRNIYFPKEILSSEMPFSFTDYRLDLKK